MKRKKIKPVLAWALVRSSGIDTAYITRNRENINWLVGLNGVSETPYIIRVKIRKAPKRRRNKAVRK